MHILFFLLLIVSKTFLASTPTPSPSSVQEQLLKASPELISAATMHAAGMSPYTSLADIRKEIEMSKAAAGELPAQPIYSEALSDVTQIRRLPAPGEGQTNGWCEKSDYKRTGLSSGPLLTSKQMARLELLSALANRAAPSTDS